MPKPLAVEMGRANFQPILNFDWNKWQNGAKTSGRRPKITEDDFRQFFANIKGITRARAAERLAEEFDCSQTAAYEALDKFKSLLELDENRLVRLRA